VSFLASAGVGLASAHGLATTLDRPCLPGAPIPRPTRARVVHACMGAVLGRPRYVFSISIFLFTFYFGFEENKT
jgi:hypothetical protein